MPEDSTRRLLRVFGVSVTECEDALAALTAALRDPAGAGGAPAGALEAYGKAARELSQRWTEVSRLIQDYQLRAQQAVEEYVRSRGA
jgi:hypothetical protein